ncbi:hypothetical protein [Embleya sp. NPDC020630]|uniref:hypothetical protein n=1 Tax=Embleya sp. NPDC020630 TaxID=3363979 RepID=UPI00379A8CD3
MALLSEHGISLEVVALVVDRGSTITTEPVHRKQPTPDIAQGAEAMDAIFGEASEDASDEGGKAHDKG